MTTILPRPLTAPRTASDWQRCPGQAAEAGSKPIGIALSLLRQSWNRRRARSLLSELDDRMLKDIGITRAEADCEANTSFWYL
ncbi:MAG: DUF1127 domain-containing protein [Alphaproteobacteria bacterium]|nr:DUF1127 domain-containing protein [Alphaproteobacteria bacterium]